MKNIQANQERDFDLDLDLNLKKFKGSEKNLRKQF